MREPVLLLCSAIGCNLPCGTDVICAFHRKRFRHLPESQKIKIMKKWHEEVTSKGKIKDTEMYQCFHCEKRHFERNMVCGDHYPKTRGSNPEIKFNINSGVCSCMPCNTSGAKTRKNPSPPTHEE